MERSERLKKLLEDHMRESSTVILLRHRGQKCDSVTDVGDSVPTSHFPLILENIKKDLNRIRARRKTKYNKGVQQDG